jgi:predicted RNA-binding Zn ribbon-like protein
MKPGSGLGDEELLIAVANTAHGEQDELADVDALRTWLRGQGVPAPGDGTEDTTTLRALRVLIRGLALRNNGIEPDLTSASGLDGLPLRLDLRLEQGGEPALGAAAPHDLARDLTAATVAALLRAMARPGWPRFKACRGDDCRWVFLDGSRNSSRRWCAMAECGNRAKVAGFRERHRRSAG